MSNRKRVRPPDEFLFSENSRINHNNNNNMKTHR